MAAQRAGVARSERGGSWLLARRRLLAALAASVAAALAALLYPLARYLQPGGLAAGAVSVELAKREIAPGEAHRFLLGGRPAIVVRSAHGFHAFWAACTHLGCTVRWRRARSDLFCPCHGARFDLEGQARGGPARAPLTPLIVEEGEETIRVRSA
jgi:cytochrome b6-f complex iron-sulfur subunit